MRNIVRVYASVAASLRNLDRAATHSAAARFAPLKPLAAQTGADAPMSSFRNEA